MKKKEPSKSKKISIVKSTGTKHLSAKNFSKKGNIGPRKIHKTDLI